MSDYDARPMKAKDLKKEVDALTEALENQTRRTRNSEIFAVFIAVFALLMGAWTGSEIVKSKYADLPEVKKVQISVGGDIYICAPKLSKDEGRVE